MDAVYEHVELQVMKLKKILKLKKGNAGKF
jgi:hypothetical protein